MSFASTVRNTARAAVRPGMLVRIAIACAAAVGLWLGVSWLLGARTSVTVPIAGRPVEFLDPTWFHVIALAPFFFLIRVTSLTDLSMAQQLLQSTLRTLVIAGVGIALARPSWVTHQSKVATVLIADVSDSISDKQLAAASNYVDEFQKSVGDGNLHVSLFPQDGTEAADYARLERLIDEVVWRFEGTICAEHGVGALNYDRVVDQKPAVELELMARLRNLMDPGTLLNPGKLVDPSRG